MSSPRPPPTVLEDKQPLVSVSTAEPETLDNLVEFQEEHVEDAEVTTGRDRRLTKNNSNGKRVMTAITPEFLLDNMVGHKVEINTAFGKKLAVYCDFTASGRAIRCIEDYMQTQVLPMYANTHSIESSMGLQTSCFREESREIIQLHCNANRAKDVVIFAGNGTTGAVHKLIAALSLQPNHCVVFVGPFEHTSNLVPWRETGCLVISIPENLETGLLDQSVLKNKLAEYSHVALRIGTFSACSNVTGRLEQVDQVTNLLHDFGALSFWDYATLAPYGRIDMSNKDAVFFRVTNDTSHRFLSDVQSREEAGTPNILADIRTGLAVKLKQAIGLEYIQPGQANRGGANQLPIFSFHTLSWRRGKISSSSLVVALLNDLYGIQARAGCLCAGPYVEKLLGMDSTAVNALETLLVSTTHAKEHYRPGWTRLSLPYFYDDNTVDYVLKAIGTIAEYGWRMLPEYRFENTSGEWGHCIGFQKHPHRVWLADLFTCQSRLNPIGDLDQQAREALERMLHPRTVVMRNAVVTLEEQEWMRCNVLPTPTRIEEEQQDFEKTVERTVTRVQEMKKAELFPMVPGKLIKPIVQASKDWGMIQPGDRLLLGLSGGKDSLCLLHCLLQIQRKAPFKFDLACVTVDPGAGQAFDPRKLIPYLAELKVPYFFEETDIFQNAKELNPSSYCAYCARMKRGALYKCCKVNGYNKLVLGQHLDDFVESFFMSLGRNGNLRTMKANYEAEDHAGIRVIRPMAYVREKQTKKFSYEAQLPIINENCPACFAKPTERERVKQWLKDQELVVPEFFESVRQALLPLMDANIYSSFAKVREQVKLANHANAATRNAKEFGKQQQKGKAPRTACELDDDEDDMGFTAPPVPLDSCPVAATQSP
ncbi:hypothetical protein BASA81_012529 [Batrachochytrium salamandrivorans]|nr:hypothetical protein BASA81_012529 [Batrachochytrium salamandrivorans]